MAYTGYPFPYNISDLLVGAVRILYATTAEPIPTSISDVIDMESPYAAQTGWVELGATRESFTYTRGFETEGLEIQQTSSVLFEEVTNVTRTIEVSMAEFNAANLALMEGAQSAAGAVVAASGISAQTTQKFGSFTTLDRYRFAFLSRRNIASGLVTESSGAVPASGTRGRFVMGVLYQAQMSADDAELEFDKGTLTAASVSFTAFGDSSVTLADDNMGVWFFETAGTIT
jgi:hypothetical protein